MFCVVVLSLLQYNTLHCTALHCITLSSDPTEEQESKRVESEVSVCFDAAKIVTEGVVLGGLDFDFPFEM